MPAANERQKPGDSTPHGVPEAIQAEISSWDSIWVTAFLAVLFGLLLLLFNWTLAAFMVALASLSSGFVIGFLFGIPRVPPGNTGPQTESQAQARQAEAESAVGEQLSDRDFRLALQDHCPVWDGEIRSIPGHFDSCRILLRLTSVPLKSHDGGGHRNLFRHGGVFCSVIFDSTILTKLFDDVFNPS